MQLSASNPKALVKCPDFALLCFEAGQKRSGETLCQFPGIVWQLSQDIPMKVSRFFLVIYLLAGSLSILQAQTLIRVVATPLEPGSPAVLRFEWDNGAPLTPQARMGLLLPREFDRAQLLLAASTRINGGFTVGNSGDTLWVERSGAGDRIAATGTLDLAVASIGLPQATERPWPFVLILQDSSRRVSLSATMTLTRP